MSDKISLPKKFIDKWNEVAQDMVVTPAELKEVKKIASQTESKLDDKIVSGLESYTKVVYHDIRHDLVKARLCLDQDKLSNSGLKVNGVTVKFTDGKNNPREIRFSRFLNGPWCSSTFTRAKKNDNEKHDPKLYIGAGYLFSRFPKDLAVKDFHGASLHLMFAPWTSPYFYPSIDADARGIFSSEGAGVSGGLGFGVNAGLSEFIGVTAKLMARIHGTSIKDEWKKSGSLDVSVGARLLNYIYFNASFPIVGGDFIPSFSLDAGARFSLF